MTTEQKFMLHFNELELLSPETLAYRMFRDYLEEHEDEGDRIISVGRWINPDIRWDFESYITFTFTHFWDSTAGQLENDIRTRYKPNAAAMLCDFIAKPDFKQLAQEYADGDFMQVVDKMVADGVTTIQEAVDYLRDLVL